MTAYEVGIDVSKWQAPERLNWRRLRDEGGVRFVVARHCYGVQVDALNNIGELEATLQAVQQHQLTGE